MENENDDVARIKQLEKRDYTKAEKERFFEENLSPLVRVGYQEAIDEVRDFCANYRNLNESFQQFFQNTLDTKLDEMIITKRQLTWDKLVKEVENSKKPVVASTEDQESQEHLLIDLLNIWTIFPADKAKDKILKSFTITRNPKQP